MPGSRGGRTWETRDFDGFWRRGHFPPFLPKRFIDFEGFFLENVLDASINRRFNVFANQTSKGDIEVQTD